MGVTHIQLYDLNFADYILIKRLHVKPQLVCSDIFLYFSFIYFDSVISKTLYFDLLMLKAEIMCN